MKRSIIFTIVSVFIISYSFMVRHDGWAQQASSLPNPYRTYPLSLSPEDVWRVVTETLVEAEYSITSESLEKYELIALGKIYEVRHGLGTKRERMQAILHIVQRQAGVYDCFLRIEVIEYWPFSQAWTPKTGADVEEHRTALGDRLTNKLRRHFIKRVSN